MSRPTPYPEVNEILGEVLAEVRSILQLDFIGMYLYGSLARGDFDRASDVDYVVVTHQEISAEHFSALDAMHQRIATMAVWCATQLEGSYLPRGALRQYDPVRAQHVHIDRGRGERLHRMHLDDPLISRAWWGGWAMLRHNLRERGITLAGPAPETLVDAVSPAELREAALAILQGWTRGILDDPAQLENRGYQPYTVLTLCRILFTLQNGAVVSKLQALQWARKNLEERWVPLIERAWLGRQNPALEAHADDLNRTLDFIHYTLECGQQWKIEGSKS